MDAQLIVGAIALAAVVFWVFSSIYGDDEDSREIKRRVAQKSAWKAAAHRDVELGRQPDAPPEGLSGRRSDLVESASKPSASAPAVEFVRWLDNVSADPSSIFHDALAWSNGNMVSDPSFPGGRYGPGSPDVWSATVGALRRVNAYVTVPHYIASSIAWWDESAKQSGVEGPSGAAYAYFDEMWGKPDFAQGQASSTAHRLAKARGLQSDY